MLGTAWAFRRRSPLEVDKFFRRAQLVSAGLYSLGRCSW
jgi:PiT family inorganic phosphate transporter